jgi:hypothetical protein
MLVAFTKSTIACLAAPSFHEGSALVVVGASASAEVGTSEVKRVASVISIATKPLRLIRDGM